MTKTSEKLNALTDGVARTALDSLPSAVSLFDPRLHIYYRNPAARQLLPDMDDLAAALQEISTEGSLANWRNRLREVIDLGKHLSLDVSVRIGPDKAESLIALTGQPLRVSENGRSIGGMLIAEDISSRITMERRLAISERLAAVGKMAAQVAHELNNPLDGILRYVNLALRRRAELPGETDEKLGLYIEHIRGGIIRMRDIVASLLEFSRAGPHAIEEATINKLVEDAVSALELRAQESHVSVVCNFLQTDMPVVRGSSLFQVFCNLIKNALDAMPDGGRLTITTQINNEDVIICFEDTGVGLPNDVEKIFEPFFTTKEPGKGTGLGLAMCRELIEKFSGTITASPSEPSGAAFVVRIPVRNCSTRAPGHHRTRKEKS